MRIILNMAVFDLSLRKFRPLQQLTNCFEKYQYYFKGKEILSPTYEQLKGIILNQSKIKKEMEDSTYLIINIKKNAAQSHNAIDSILSSGQFAKHLTEQQVQMIKENPSYLWQRKEWKFEYMRDQSQTQISQERLEELRHQILTNHQNWRQASFEQLETVTKNRYQLYTKALNQ